MATRPNERGRKRPVRYWLFIVTVLLAPVFLQAQTFTCVSGDTTLVEFAEGRVMSPDSSTGPIAPVCERLDLGGSEHRR